MPPNVLVTKVILFREGGGGGGYISSKITLYPNDHFLKHFKELRILFKPTIEYFLHSVYTLQD